MYYDETLLLDRKCKILDVICPICGVTFSCEKRVLKRNIKAGILKYCSVKCWSTLNAKERISTPCLQCGENVEILQSQRKKNKNVFCSHSCSAKYNNDIKNKADIESGKAAMYNCQNCGKTNRCYPCLKKSKKFCSRKCQNAHYNTYEEVIIYNEQENSSKTPIKNAIYKNRAKKVYDPINCLQCGSDVKIEDMEQINNIFNKV